jgi:hypothetical protein
LSCPPRLLDASTACSAVSILHSPLPRNMLACAQFNSNAICMKPEYYTCLFYFSF